MGHFVQFRAIAGPPYENADSATAYDWTQHDTGDAYDPITAIPPTTLTAGLASGATTATVASTTGWPSAGWVWIGPNGAGQSWERCRYTGKTSTTLTGLTRETVDAEQTGAHSSGAAVRFWWELETATGDLVTVSEMMEGEDGVPALSTWAGGLSGVAAPQAAIGARNLLIVLKRWYNAGTGNMGAWQIARIGWIDLGSIQDSADQTREWEIAILSSGTLLADIDVDGVRVGAVDVAQESSASASSALSSWRKEAHSGDYTGEPTFDAGNTTDGNIDSLWIADRYLFDQDNDPTGDYAITQIHIAPYIGQGAGYRWIEVKAGENDIHIQLIAAGGETIGITSNQAAPGGLIIFAENAALFQEENPGHEAAQVVDVGAFDNTFFNALDPAGGSLRLFWPPTSGALDHVVWGSGTVHGGWESLWSGPAVTAPTAGQTMRYIYSPSPTPTNTRDYWQTSHVMHPGHFADADAIAWLAYELPRLELTLHEDIDNDDTAIIIADAAGPSGDGLPTSGTLQINNEQMTYSSLNRATGAATIVRAANSTSAAAHSAGDRIYLVAGGVATDGRLISSVAIASPAGISAIPKNFVIRGSAQSTARTPDQPDYTADYEVLATVTNSSANPYTLTLSPAKRLRYIVIEIQDMSATPARPRLGSVTISEDMSVYGATTLAIGDVADAVAALLSAAGLPAGALVDVGDTLAVSDYTTANDTALGVLADMAEITGSRITVRPDSKIEIRRDTLWASGSLPSAAATYSRTQIARAEWLRQGGRRISQIDLEWRTADNSSSGRVKFPTTPDPQGRIVRMGPVIAASEEAATTYARRRYWVLRRPWSLLGELADVDDAAEAGQIHRVQWQFDDAMTATDRTYLAMMVQQTLKMGDTASHRQETVVNWLQVSREDEK